MPHDDPSGHRPPPQPSAKPPREVEGFDERLWSYGSVIAAIIAAIAIVGAVIWVVHGDHQTATRAQAQVTAAAEQNVNR